MKFISLFAGIGGFDLGLERSGMKCILQVEINKHCQRVLAHHYPKINRIADVKEVKKEHCKNARLLCGGFPCQDIYLAGRRLGLAGHKSGLFNEMSRIIDELRPKWILIENIANLLSINQGKDMATVVTTLADFGYGWAYRLFNTRDFGIPQQRRRVFIVGCLGSIENAARVVFEPEAKKKYDHGSQEIQKDNDSVSKGKITRGKRIIAFPSGKMEFRIFHRFYPTLKTQPTYICYETNEGETILRSLSRIEYCRLQGFPDDWLDLNPELSINMVSRMTGNAISVPIAEFLGRNIIAIEQEGID